MTKIYEALEQAKIKRQLEKEPDESSESPESSRGYFQKLAEQYKTKESKEISPVPAELKLNESLSSLYQNISVILSSEKCKIIQFISARASEGTSLLVREFAKICAFKLKKRVLLLDVEPGPGGQLDSFNMDGRQSLLDSVKRNESAKNSIIQVADSLLNVACIVSHDVTSSLEPNSNEFNSVLSEIEGDYDFILIDTPSHMATSDALLLSKRVDGFVIVVEAEKTRWQVVERLKSRLLAQDANILGVLFNKRNFPIPNFIYKYL